MLDFIQSFDRDLLHKINSEWSSSFGDLFFPLLTDFNKSAFFQWIFVPLIILLIIWSYRLRSVWIFVGLAALLFLTDWSLGHLLRDQIGRLRPFLVEHGVTVRSAVFGDLSFPSLHASNSMGLAVYFSHFFPALRALFIAVALLVGFSRVYCGVHYPTDVLAGIFFGWVAARIVIALVDPFMQKKSKIPRFPHARRFKRRR